MQNQEDTALLKAYIYEWSNFVESSAFLPQPFFPLESLLVGKHHLSGPNKRKIQDSTVRKVRFEQLHNTSLKCMLATWDARIFEGIKHRLEKSSMKLIQDEREGKPINSVLVIGIRESCVNLSNASNSKALDYVNSFQDAYTKSMESFYRPRTSQYIEDNGIRVR